MFQPAAFPTVQLIYDPTYSVLLGALTCVLRTLLGRPIAGWYQTTRLIARRRGKSSI